MSSHVRTFQVSEHVRRIEAVEKDLKALADSSASKEDISRVRAEIKKLYDGLHVGQCPSARGRYVSWLTMREQNFWTYEHMCGDFVSIQANLCESLSAD